MMDAQHPMPMNERMLKRFPQPVRVGDLIGLPVLDQFAMLALESFNRAKAASYAEAALIGDLYNLSVGFADPEKSSIRNEIFEYTRRLVNVEWPAQAEGRMVDQASIYLNGLNKLAFALHPSGQADGDLHSLLLQAIQRLWDARQERLLAAQTTIPDIVWFVVSRRDRSTRPVPAGYVACIL